MNHEEIKALYEKVRTYNAFSGSDEWDLNDAFRDGFTLALDIVLSTVRPEYLSENVDEEDSAT